MPTLCLGEALVDLVCERPVDGLEQADGFVPRSGGAVANAAVVAARCGADVELAGGVGDDPWGRWLIERLGQEGVGLARFARVPNVPTPVAFVTVNEQAEPSFAVYGEGIAATIGSLDDSLEQAVGESDAIFFGSNTLVGELERELTLRARALAIEQRKPVLFDPNFRLHRWSDPAEAVETVRSICEGSLFVKVNRDEAVALTGEEDPGAAAEALVALGVGVVVVTLGADGALVRGAAHAAVGGFPVATVDTTGAGDVLAGVLMAALAASRFDPASVGDALAAAVEAASKSTEGWGAIDALPIPMPRFS